MHAGAAGSRGGGGLIGLIMLLVLIVLIAGVILAVTGAYPKGLFELILGLNRWTLRVAAYAGLMTDVYPPFRLDQGGHDPLVLDLVERPADQAPSASGPTARPARSGQVVRRTRMRPARAVRPTVPVNVTNLRVGSLAVTELS